MMPATNYVYTRFYCFQVINCKVFTLNFDKYIKDTAVFRGIFGLTPIPKRHNKQFIKGTTLIYNFTI